MAILASITAFGLPNMVNLRKPYKVNAAVRQIAADMQVARQRAIARNARYRINFNAVAKTWTLERESSPGSNSWTSDGGGRALPSGTAFGDITPGNPIFGSTGILTGAVTVPVTMTGAHTRTVTINVLGRTTIS